MTVIRARLKPIAEYPSGTVCCDAWRAREERLSRDLILHLSPGVFVRDAACQFCHRVFPRVKYMNVISGPFAGTAALVGFLEFDEGLAP